MCAGASLKKGDNPIIEIWERLGIGLAHAS